MKQGFYDLKLNDLKRSMIYIRGFSEPDTILKAVYPGSLNIA